jgi:hypothetical protein
LKDDAVTGLEINLPASVGVVWRWWLCQKTKKAPQGEAGFHWCIDVILP